MKTYFIIISFIFITSIQATDVSGNQSGIWDLSGSPYNIIGEITVPTGETLEIDAGVEVIAMGNYKITALGNIQAQGAISDTIRFYGNGGLNWGGLRLEDEVNESQFEYCRISNTDDINDYGIQSINSPVLINNSYFDDHQKAISFSAFSSNDPSYMEIKNSKIAYVQKSGITITDNSNVLIDSCEVTRCGLGASFYGAIQLSLQNNSHSCNPTITNNYIHHNDKQGITLANLFNYDNMAPTVEYNDVSYNYTGIYLYVGKGTYKWNHIHHNFVENNPDSGAGVMLYGDGVDAVFTYNKINNNYTGFYLTAEATVNLGDLNNTDPDDDGYNCIYDNIFYTGEEYSVYNASSMDVTAENNVWDDDPPIDVTIIDGNDNPAYGIVDYEPTLSAFAPPDSIYLSDQYVCEPIGIAYPTYLFPTWGWNLYIDGVLVATIPLGEQYMITGLESGYTYLLGISYVYEEGESEIVETTFTYIYTLNPPQNPQVIIDYPYAIFSWDDPEPGSTSPPSNLGFFNVYLDGVIQGTTNDNEWIFEDLFIGETYFAEVCANYEAGCSELVEVEFIYTSILNPPQNAQATSSGYITWEEPEPGSTSPFLHYNVYLDGELDGTTNELFYQLTDLINGQQYMVGLSAQYEAGESDILEFELPYVSSYENTVQMIEQLNNYPNPFNPTTTISFKLTNEITKDTKIVIYNLKGQKLRTFECHTELVEARHSIIWNGTDNSGKPVSSGIYFYKLISDGKNIASKKMLLLK